MKRNITLLALLLALGLGFIRFTSIIEARSAASRMAPLMQGQNSLSINDVQVTEGNSGTVNAVFTVTLSSSDFHDSITVSYATADGQQPGGATVADNDYVRTSGTLTFGSGEGGATMTISVPVIGDTRNEGNETFFVNLSNASPAGSVTISKPQGVCTILDDEGGCTYSISPLNRVFTPASGDTTGEINVTAPAGCRWTATTNVNWISLCLEGTCSSSGGSGNGTVQYRVTNNNPGWRAGAINIAGQVHMVYQNPPECPIDLTCRFFPGVCISSANSMLSVSRSFRDDVLAQTPRGQRYTHLYYQFSSEAVQILMLNPMLMLRSREIIERYKPVIQSMVNGEEVTLTDGDLEEIDSFLNSFAAKGSSDLQEAITSVCKDLRDPQVHKEFGITVTAGPKRSMPELSLDHTIRQTGGAAALLGFCVAFVFCFTRGRDKKTRTKTRRWLCATLAILLVGAPWSVARGLPRITRSRGSLAAQPKSSKPARSRPSNSYGKLPLAFEANKGQTDSQVRFMSRGNGHSLLLMPTEAAFRLRIADRGLRNEKPIAPFLKTAVPKSDVPNPASEIVRMKLISANPESQMAGLDQLSGTHNYFIGSDPAKWRADVPTYAKVKCEQVYPGIDMVYYGNQHELEYDFRVAPGADPRAIRLGFDGAERTEIDGNGDLALSMAGSKIRQRKPVAYQEVNGIRRIVPADYVVRNPQSPIRNHEVGFELGAYDTTRPLIIDPVLAYSTYLGGSGDDEGNAITVDSSGNVYVIGFTNSPNFPTSGASQPTLGGGLQDVFVTKLNPSGTQLIYSTYLGGNGQDNGSAIAVDSAGNAYITGFTGSTNFPVRNAMQPAKNGPFNAFVAKLDPAGSLSYSTHLGGSVGDYGSSIAVDSSGNVYVAGVATSVNFPMANAIQPAFGGAADVYLAKLNPSGSQLLYSTYLGGAGTDGASSIAIDSPGNLYVTGVTDSKNFRTANPLQAAHGGGLFDAFVAKVNPSGSQLVYSTYLGGTGEDRGFRIAVDSDGNAYVTGDTDSTNFPTASALQRIIGGSVDAFVTKLNPSGTQLVYSTYLGGSGIDGGTAIAVGPSGSAYVTGFTGSTNFPTAAPLQQAFAGGSFDGFVAKLSASGAALDYSTYIGGSGIDAGFCVAVDSSGNAYVMGQTNSTNFPTAAALQQGFGGGASDVFIAKIRPGPAITSAIVSGKKLLVSGTDFDDGAKILLNGEPQKTRNDEQNPATALIAKKAGANISPGQTVTLQVRNGDGTVSNQFTFTR